MNTLQIQTSSFSEIRTYLTAAFFIAGNILLPWICHLIPSGGPMLLPIYFFTLIGSYLYGWKAGLLTAIASPLLNFILAGMPSAEALPAIMIKSVLLTAAASVAARRFDRPTLLILLAVVMVYQIAGTFAEWAISGDLYVSLQDFRIGIPGMAVQVLASYLILRKAS